MRMEKISTQTLQLDRRNMYASRLRKFGIHFALLLSFYVGSYCVLSAFGNSDVSAKLPGTLLDLTNWRLTLPVEHDRSGQPVEVSQPELETFADNRFFHSNATADGIFFRAPCGGATTKGSRYPRTELREMTNAGSRRADWSTGDPHLHELQLKLAVTATPVKKRHVVCTQIHDADDDLLMIRLEGTKLFIERNDVGDVMLDRNYKLGTPFTINITAGSGRVRVSYNDVKSLDWPVNRAGCYFKAGCYTQSNPEKGDFADAFGEVVIYELQLK